MSTPRASKSPTVPALIAKLGGGKGGGLTFKKALAYDSGKPGAEFVWTNLETMDQAAWNRQADAFRALAPSLKRAVDHWSLSLDPRLGKLSRADWEEGARAFLDDLGYQGCIATVYRHTDEPQDHAHIAVLRLRFGKDGKVETVCDSHIYKRSHIAAERAARKLGLKPLPAREDAAEAPAPTDTQVAANRRAKRRGTPVVKHEALAKAVESAVVRSTTVEELVARCAEVGIEVEVKTKEPSMAIQGLRFKPVGVEEWTKASELKRDRSLSWSKLEPRLLRNGELRARAQAEADRINAAARVSAAARVAVRLAQQPEHPVTQSARALPPGAANQAKEANTMDDDLAFLNPPPPPRPADVPLDDAGLVPTLTGSAAAGGEAQVRHKKKLEVEQQDRDRDQAKLDMMEELKKFSVKELLDLKSSVPPFVLTAAMIERLIFLMLRFFSLGLIRSGTALSDALAARQELQQYAAAELDRRRRTPASVADRKAFLQECSEAVQERSTALHGRAEALDKRRSDQKTAGLYRDHAAEAAVLRSQLQAGLDRRQVANGHETIAARRAAHHAAVVAHRAARDLVPVGFTGLLITKSQRDAAAAAKAQAALTLRQAVERRAAAKAQLQLLLDEVEEAALKREQEAAEHAAAASKADKIERDALARELRALPDQIREVGVAVQRVLHQERAVALIAEHNRPKTPAELEAVEAERLRQLELANRRG